MSSSPGSQRIDLAVSRRYRLRRKLGAGAIGTVFLAEDLSAGRPVALKVIRTERLGPRGLRLLQREFEAIRALRHPQIAAAYDFGYTEEGRVPFYTREYVFIPRKQPASAGRTSPPAKPAAPA
jgi:serine/threonine protein kinase